MDGLEFPGGCKDADGASEIAARTPRWVAFAWRSALAGVLLLGLLAASLAGPLARGAYGEAAWTTYHHDAARSGVDPEALDPITPTLAWQSPDLGAPIWSQPLILGSRVYVATLANRIYALDATTGAVIWEQNAGIPVPRDPSRCQPSVGIVGTPVIDASTGTLYAVADTWDPSTEEAHHLLEGFKIANGERVLSTPVDPPGSNPKTLLERPALNLDQGKVVFGFGGNPGDCGIYSGAVVAAPEDGGTPSFWQYKPASPAFGGAAVWGPSGAAVDEAGHVYIGTGNPNFPDEQEVSTYDYSDSLLELDSSMSLLGNFAPESWLSDSNNDRDLGSSGPELLPGGLLFQAGKNEMGYLIDEASMGSGAPAVFAQKVCKGVKGEGEGEGSFGGDAYAAGTIYVPCIDGVRALTYNQAARTFSPLWHGPTDAIGPPIVSNGLVWVISGKFLEGAGTTLYGLDPATGVPRYTETLPSPTADHFASPSAAAGRVFAATGSSITAFQIAEPPPMPPDLVTGEASSLTQTSATLAGTVSSDTDLSECRFDYGPTSAYGSSVACSSLPSASTTPVAVSATLHGLLANSSYHFRIVASNQGGTNLGNDQLFTTPPQPPTVLTQAASSLTQTSATLNASLDPEGVALTDCHFDYGPTTALGASVPCAQRPEAGTVAVTVSAPLRNLTADTTYYFRIVAANAGGESVGALATATTLAPVTTSPAPPGENPSPPPITPPLGPALTGIAGQGVLGSLEEKAVPNARPRLLGVSLKAHPAGVVEVKLSCPAAAHCRGNVTLRSLLGTRPAHHGNAKGLVLATASFTLSGGAQAILKLQLNAAARKLIARHRVLHVLAVIATHDPAAGASSTATPFTLRRP